MRYLISAAESTVWAQYSALVFLVLFVGLIYRVYRTSARQRYVNESNIVFDDGIKK